MCVDTRVSLVVQMYIRYCHVIFFFVQCEVCRLIAMGWCGFVFFFKRKTAYEVLRGLVDSEMGMRDGRWEMRDERWEMRDERWEMRDEGWEMSGEWWALDADEEELSVDLGGRCIINKKPTNTDDKQRDIKCLEDPNNHTWLCDTNNTLYVATSMRQRTKLTT